MKLILCELGYQSVTPEELSFLWEQTTDFGLSPIRVCSETFLNCLRALETEARRADDEEEKLMNPRCLGAAVEVALAMAEGMIESDKNRLIHFVENSINRCLSNPSISGSIREIASLSGHRSNYSHNRSLNFPGGHIVVCTTGAPDFGPGATKTLTYDPNLPEIKVLTAYCL